MRGSIRRLMTTAITIAVTAAAVPQLQAQTGILHEGTAVRMRLNRTLSSADARTGETVDFETLDDVVLDGVTVIPKSSTAVATVTEAASKKRMGRGGKLAVNIDYVRLPSGEKLALRGVQDLKGGGHAGAMTGAMVATGIVFFPAAPLFLFMHGKDITIPKGHEVTVYTNSDYKVAAAPVRTASTDAEVMKPRGNALTNADVLKLKGAGLSEQLIVQKIKNSPGSYSLEAEDMISLKKAGISETVIGAMLEAGAGR